MGKMYTIVREHNQTKQREFLMTGRNTGTPFSTEHLKSAKAMATRDKHDHNSWYTYHILEIDSETLSMREVIDGYTVEKVVLARLSPAHIPYVYYAVLKNEAGNEIFCDLYNIEQLFYSKLGPSMITKGTAEDVIKRYGRIYNKILLIDLGNTRGKASKPDDYSCALETDKKIRTRLIRNNNKALFEKVKANFYLEETFEI